MGVELSLTLLTSRNRSSSSLSQHHLLEVGYVDDDTLYLPGSSSVYVTRTKNGKPALARKKGEKLLQDYGFDMLGQSLGIPSRMDFERKTRRMSIGSQSSGVLSKPETPLPGRSILKSGNNRHEYEYEYPAAALKSRSARSSSTPAPSTMYHPNISTAPKPCHDHVAAAASSCSMSGALHPPPPPFPPPSQPAQFWNTQPMMNGMPAMMPGYPYMANQHVHSHGYPPQVTHTGGPPSWATQNSYMAQHYVNPLGLPVPQSTSMLLLPQQYSAYYHTVGPTPNPTHIPPPPPPPPPSMARSQGFVEKISDGDMAKLIEKQTKTSGKRGSSTVSQSRSIRAEKRTEDSRGRKLTERERISRRIRHFHICAGCGKKRSKEYQRAHPLKRGEIPEPDYCHRCIRDAIISDTESLSSLTADDASFIQFSKEAPVPRPSTDESRAAESGQCANEKTRRGSRWIKKSRRLNMLSGMLSSVTNSKVRLNSPEAFSSTEESRSRASSLVPNLNVTTRAPKRSRGSSRPSDNKSRESMLLPEASASICSSHKPVNKAVSSLSKPSSREMSSSPTASHYRGRQVEKRMLSETVTSSISSRPHGMEGVANTSQHNSQQELPRMSRRMEPQVTSKVPSVAPRRVSPNVPVENSSQVPSKLSSVGPGRTSRLPTKGIKSDDGPSISPAGYKQPSVRNEASEVAAIVSDTCHETRDNIDNQRAPSQPIIETQSQSSKENSPREEFIPFPDANTKSRFRNWEDTYFPMPDPPDFKYASRWGEPPTPSDPPYGGAAFPCFIRDPWSYSQSDVEREAEEMAEQDLAAAGKLFGDFGSSWGGSGTSCFPISSSLTRSMISIESCDSDEYRNDRNVAYEMAEASDAEETVGGGDKSVKKLEFSSEDDRHRKTAGHDLKRLADKRSGEIRKSPSKPAKLNARNLYDNDDNNDSDTSSDILPGVTGSSIIAHTGHSLDNLAMNPSGRQNHDETTVSGARQRLRRFVRQ
ncbi:hypothetical protein F4775DRAFT_604028 [Biscogniauxia sp. FL1348]|nr:hypothetical protein F4775DRAFT_604028 [Biscogniauxia sp. FL1348]